MRPPAPRRPARAWASAIALAAAGAVAVAGCLYAAGVGAGTDSDAGAGTPEGHTAAARTAAVRAAGEAEVLDAAARPDAPELAGDDLDGQPVSLAALRGQVVVINVWGSWCGPCRAEADELARLSAETRPAGVRFLGINTRDRDRAAARSFVRSHALDFPSIHDPDGRLLLRFPAALLNPQAIPSTLVIDRRGRVAAAIGGAVTGDQLRPLLTRVAEETP
ncbi:TlpA disulfide reductase family protein [Streptomyces sp. NPDC006326]|uniref:TlpA family protein disulfide reductase n=1 Tax=Streptomyces sp. NPDC006326 TaxID=3156752 RepID=UPI0033BAD8D9